MKRLWIAAFLFAASIAGAYASSTMLFFGMGGGGAGGVSTPTCLWVTGTTCLTTDNGNTTALLVHQ